MTGNEAAFSLAVVPFSACDGESYLVVGTASNVVQSPQSFTAGYLRVYKFREDGSLELQHQVCFFRIIA